MRKSKLRLDWWGSGMDWVNELTLQSNGGHLPGDQYLGLAARQFLAQNFPGKKQPLSCQICGKNMKRSCKPVISACHL